MIRISRIKKRELEKREKQNKERITTETPLISFWNLSSFIYLYLEHKPRTRYSDIIFLSNYDELVSAVDDYIKKNIRLITELFERKNYRFIHFSKVFRDFTKTDIDNFLYRYPFYSKNEITRLTSVSPKILQSFVTRDINVIEWFQEDTEEPFIHTVTETSKGEEYYSNSFIQLQKETTNKSNKRADEFIVFLESVFKSDAVYEAETECESYISEYYFHLLISVALMMRELY